MAEYDCRRATYDDASNAALWVAVALQVLRDCDEDAWWKRHVEYPVGLLAALFDFLEVLFQLNEGLVLVVLTRHVRAEAAEFLQLLLDLLCWGLDVGLDALEVLLVVHLCSRISDNANVFGEEVVAVLQMVNYECVEPQMVAPTRPNSAGNYSALVTLHWQCGCRWITHGLFLRQITRGTKNHYDGVVFELHVAV
jgi:hypothetical protein